MINSNKFKEIEISSPIDLHNWLLRNHSSLESVWLVTHKKIVADRYVSRDEVLDQLVAFGWIDGVREQIDHEKTRQLISPRKTKPWALSYKTRAERLISQGLMQDSGLESVELAKKSGGWNEMEEVDALLVPDDLFKALKSRTSALGFFEAFPPSTRRNILRWIASAKTPTTRNKRIEATVVEAAVNKRVKSHG